MALFLKLANQNYLSKENITHVKEHETLNVLHEFTDQNSNFDSSIIKTDSC